MLTLSYNLSEKLKLNLDKIEFIRRDMLVLPLPPQKDLSLRWDATVTRVYFSCSLDGRLIKKDLIEKILTLSHAPQQKKHEKDMLKYKNSLDWIEKGWFASQKPVTVEDIVKLYDLSCYGNLRVSMHELSDILQYVQAQEESPIVNAAIAIICFVMLKPFTEDNDRISRLTGMLMLTRFGYDFRGLFSVEELWSQHLIAINQLLKQFLSNSNITLWLETFAEYSLSYVQNLRQKLYSPMHTITKKSDFALLNERQKDLLYAFSFPGSIITNKTVQSRYRVSQITASRDLQKLTILGLLLQLGRGRSVYYTKA